VRQAGWKVTNNVDASVRQMENSHRENGGNDDNERCWTAGESRLKTYKETDGGEADRKGQKVSPRHGRDDVEDTFEEIAAHAFNAEQLGELGRRDVERCSRFKSDQDRVGNEVGGVGK